MTTGGVKLGGEELVRVVVRQATYDKIAHKVDRLGDYQPEIIYEDGRHSRGRSANDAAIGAVNSEPRDVSSPCATASIFRSSPPSACSPRSSKRGIRSCSRTRFVQRGPASGFSWHSSDRRDEHRRAALRWHRRRRARQGDMVGTGLHHRVSAGPVPAAGLQHSPGRRRRIFKTDYVACPSCGRTLFNLQSTTARIKAATAHLKGVKIAIMGCIVNGPGEMADADFGYVGGAPGKVNLYVGKTAVKFNIPEEEAVERLKDLIREHGKWMEARLAVGEVA